MKKLLFCLFLISVPAFGQLATPVTVNSEATTSGTVTITTAAPHGLSVNQGFCLSVAANCFVAATVPTSTTLTFPGNLTCSSACGTIQAAPQVIVLSTTQPTGNMWSATVLFWLTTTKGVPGRASQWAASGSSAGATSAQNAALVAGLFLEQGRSYTWSTAQSLASIQTELQNDYNAAQATFSASIQPAQYYGVVFNGGWGNQ